MLSVVFRERYVLYTGGIFVSKPFTCSACGQMFTSLVTFDKHRTGRFTDDHPHYGRSCLSKDQITTLGLTQDEKHRWYDPKLRPATLILAQEDAPLAEYEEFIESKMTTTKHGSMS